MHTLRLIKSKGRGLRDGGQCNRCKTYTRAEAGTSARLPSDAGATVRQVASSIIAAYEEGVERQMIEMPLPLTGATELDDWPGGIQQQFTVAKPMVTQLLKLLSTGLDIQDNFVGKIIDDSDAVASWTSDNVFVVLFPTGDTLGEIQEVSGGKSLTIMLNPQWRSGQVVSDFGFFGRKRKEDFVGTFTTTYGVQSKRARGQSVWIRQHLKGCELFIEVNGQAELLEVFDTVPPFSTIEKCVTTYLEAT